MSMRHLYHKKKPYCYVLLLIFIFVVSAILTCRVKRLVFAEINLENTHKMLQVDLEYSVFMNKGKGCKIPRLHPFDKDVMELEKELPAATCSGNNWVECYLEECFVMPSIRKKLKDLFCEYRDIVYVNDLEHRLGPSTKLSADQKYILKVTDHVHVACSGLSRQSFTPLQWSGYKTGFRRVPTNQRPCCGPRLNVMMLCFHSMSKNGFIRKMPRSHAALKEMGALLLNGYNIVGEGSSAALFPILTGKTHLEFPEIRKRFTKNFIDEKSFIFRDLSKMG
ncbi:hypothetical protein MSG28_015776 [Choristoneura fumiferana]|uniref:Uncharacterized protein n=2 Tax=Choristoneura fumiferana TaxID=7141 RepID=A0ACC0KBV3_CHOFU|nr:hypothetical protein MSG28_015776 [Choristoneura fumiferana]